MIGYSSKSKVYRLFNPENNKVILSRDVIFLEQNISCIKKGEDYYQEILSNENDNSEENMNLLKLPSCSSENINNVSCRR